MCFDIEAAGYGIAVSVLGGGAVTWTVDRWLSVTMAGMKFASVFSGDDVKRARELPLDYLSKPSVGPVPPWFTGLVERIVFTCYMGTATDSAFDNAAIVLGGWMVLKMSANWTHPATASETSRETVQVQRRMALRAAVLGLLSMAFAYSGGMIWRP